MRHHAAGWRALSGHGLLVFFCLALATDLCDCRAKAQVNPSDAAAKEASRNVAEGFEFLSQNRAADAEAVFRKVLEAQPQLAEAHRGLGLALWAQGKPAAALQELTQATRLAPQDAESHFALGRLAWGLSTQRELAQGSGSKLPSGDYQNLATSEMEKASTLRPQAIEIRSGLADLYLEAGRAQDALPHALWVGNQAPSASAHLRLGRVYLAMGEEDKAESELKASIALEPKNAEAYFQLGQLRLIQRKLPQAQAELRRAIEVSPDFAPAYAALGELLVRTGQPAEARPLFEKAVALDPQDENSQYRLATLLMETGDARRATELLENILRRQPGFSAAREQLGMSLLRRNDLAGATSEANTILAQKPQAAEGHRLMALVLWRQRDVEASLTECAQALAEDPDSVSMLALQALGLWRLNRKKEAQRAFVQAEKIQRQIVSGAVFCRLILCDAQDAAAVQDFVRRNRWVITPYPEP